MGQIDGVSGDFFGDCVSLLKRGGMKLYLNCFIFSFVSVVNVVLSYVSVYLREKSVYI